MAKKADLLTRAAELGLELSERNTVAEIEAAILAVESSSQPVEEVVIVSEETTVVESTEVSELNETESVESTDSSKSTAKAGKRSEKSLKEAAEKAEKEARKQAGDTTPQDEDAESNVKKGPKPVTRPKLERRGKNYQAVAKKVEANKTYNLSEAIQLAATTNPSKFDASVEIHARLGVDPRQADQNIRTTVSLPHGTGKTIRVAVFAPESEHAAAKTAGADIVGDEDFLKQLESETLNFDVLVATPQYMPKLGKYARLLGPRGLMPNPKSGTVANDIKKAVTEAKSGKVEYRVDKQAIVHLAIGKVSFGAEKLEQNAKAFFDSLQAQKPSSLKGAYVKTISVSTTQGPGIKVENSVS